MPSDNEKEIFGNFLVVTNLFIVGPVGYILDAYIIYKILNGDTSLNDGAIAKNLVFFVLMFILLPLMHWYSFRYCRDNFGWFKKK